MNFGEMIEDMRRYLYKKEDSPKYARKDWEGICYIQLNNTRHYGRVDLVFTTDGYSQSYLKNIYQEDLFAFDWEVVE